MGALIQRFYGGAWAVSHVQVVWLWRKKKGKWFLQVLALGIFFAIGAFIPFMNDAEHLTKHEQAATIPIYVIANDLYVFFWGLLTYRITKSIKTKAVVLSMLFFVFLVVHFVFYAPMFPEFYWS